MPLAGRLSELHRRLGLHESGHESQQNQLHFGVASGGELQGHGKGHREVPIGSGGELHSHSPGFAGAVHSPQNSSHRAEVPFQECFSQ